MTHPTTPTALWLGLLFLFMLLSQVTFQARKSAWLLTRLLYLAPWSWDWWLTIKSITGAEHSVRWRTLPGSRSKWQRRQQQFFILHYVQLKCILTYPVWNIKIRANLFYGCQFLCYDGWKPTDCWVSLVVPMQKQAPVVYLRPELAFFKRMTAVDGDIKQEPKKWNRFFL